MAYAVYKKTQWVNDIPPSIDDVNLLKMEEGIYQNSLRVNDLLAICERQDRELNAVRADISALGKRMTTAENDIKGIKSDITTINNTKANKSDVPTNNEMSSALDGKVNNSDFANLQNYVNNTFRKITDSYTKTEVNNKLDGKLNNNGDTGTGNYTFNKNVKAKGELSTDKGYIIIGGHKLYLHNGDAHIYA